MQILELFKKHPDAFATIPNAAEVLGNVVAKMQELGYSALANNTKEPMYIEKGQFDQVNNQAAELTKQFEEFKKATKGNEELTQAIKDWENKYKDGMLTSAIKLSAMKSKAKDAGDILALIDKSKLTLKDDHTVEGLDDQLKVIKESKGYLFEEGTVIDGANPAGTQNTETQKLASDFSAGLKGI